MLKVKYKKLFSDAQLPSYSRPDDAALDLYSREDKVLKPGEKYIFRLGFATEFSQDYVALNYRRSGLAKQGVFVPGVGVIDANFRGEWGVLLYNSSEKAYTVSKGDRIAQVIFHKIDKAEFVEANELSDSHRGAGDFGSSGK